MTGQGKSAIDTLLAESFKELALKQPIENRRFVDKNRHFYEYYLS